MANEKAIAALSKKLDSVEKFEQALLEGGIVNSDIVQAGFFPKNMASGGKIYPNPASRVLNLQFSENPDGPVEVARARHLPPGAAQPRRP